MDVEQIMRDIRGRIAQRQGIDLSNQQIQDLAARRLESILDPRAIKPSLLDGLKRSAATPTGESDKIPNEPTFSFEDTTIYDSHRGALRFARRLFNPLLKLFFNPNPVIQALHLQAKLNVEAVERNAERDRRQTEWNALHYEIVQRLVTEVSRVTIELQALSLRVESLAARVDFNDRRVGNLEGAAHRSRPQGKPNEVVVTPPATENDTPRAEPPATTSDAQATASDPARRRRRRRRGRRSGGVSGEFVAAGAAGGAAHIPAAATNFVDHSSNEEDEGDEPEEALELPEPTAPIQTRSEQTLPDPLPEPVAQESPVVLPPNDAPPED